MITQNGNKMTVYTEAALKEAWALSNLELQSTVSFRTFVSLAKGSQQPQASITSEQITKIIRAYKEGMDNLNPYKPGTAEHIAFEIGVNND